jgi:peptide/nickel transport system permease protein
VTAPAIDHPFRPRSLWWRNFASRGPGFAIGLAIVLGLLAASLLAPVLPLRDPLAPDYAARLIPPGAEYWMGTDNLGRDIFSRVIHGARIDLTLGISTVIITCLTGMTLGLIAGYYGGIAGAVLMRVTDSVLAFPFIVLVLAIVAVVGPGLQGVYIGIIAVAWTIYARITYAEMTVLRERQFIMAARTLGYSDARIILRHALPNVIRPNVSYGMSDVIQNMLGLAALSYLGVGVKPPEPEWGAMIVAGQEFLLTAWWISIMPGIAAVVAGTGFLLLGEAISARMSVDRGGAAPR